MILFSEWILPTYTDQGEHPLRTVLLPTVHSPSTVATISAQSGETLVQLLQRAFGFSSFRVNQEVVCRAAIEGKDVLLVMPTGAGKSLCFQLPELRAAARPWSLAR